MKCKDVMTLNPKCCMTSASAQEVAQLMKEENIGIVPILDEKTQKLMGVVTDRDLCLGVVAGGKNPKEAKASEFMSKNPHTCREEESVQKAEEQMKKGKIGRIPVVDSNGLCVGIISQADIALRGGQPKEVFDTFRAVSQRSTRVRVV